MHVFSDSKAEAVMKGDTRNNRNDIAGQSMDIERHVCPVNTSVPILHKLQEFMSEAGLAPESFPDQSEPLLNPFWIIGIFDEDLEAQMPCEQ